LTVDLEKESKKMFRNIQNPYPEKKNLRERGDNGGKDLHLRKRARRKEKEERRRRGEGEGERENTRLEGDWSTTSTPNFTPKLVKYINTTCARVWEGDLAG